MSPTLILVHGAWHDAWCWEKLVDRLPDVDVRTVSLPSSGSDTASLGDLYDDARAVRAAVTAVDGPVVVCAHSYGGLAVTEAAGDLPGVRRLVYLAAFQLDEGESLLGVVGGTPPDWWDVHDGHVDVRRPEEIFYGDVDPDTAAASVARLAHQSLPALSQPLTKVAWKSIPSTYVVCEKDAAIPVPAQEAMSGRSERVLRMDASHSPFLSRPDALADLLRAELD
ncbi:alpha/beta hydrolase [Actinomadura craniellae]|uniref:Alpha/beta hydrolase n=1 Tax=Actinomadura craniellae TaxID=2231787 RepID=A0A365H913_9ACTN|nr:alpha/beta hydrolase [Actinomadura craniellae]RAY15577.1 alpha/beta hydrolase [Actinomadura craniellae]